MTSQRRRDTSPERELRRELHARGLRFRVDYPIPVGRRKADIVFPRRRIAVFVDGCFWHGCPVHASWPKNNAAWWRAKLERNRARDADTTARLMEAGWRVFRVWEHEDVATAAGVIETAVASAAPRPA